ncbi:unnamed protein product [Nippostrongylus brasiliensis]|uniref:Uncharacterized protein n=1 Tax=Nippostrongylus brasiliensis TaxID=27835 RepID=A0A0N4Y4F1_NIPBR|nr:unnamed protein product [Nippostrongylus brasiliensis]
MDSSILTGVRLPAEAEDYDADLFPVGIAAHRGQYLQKQTAPPPSMGVCSGLVRKRFTFAAGMSRSSELTHTLSWYQAYLETVLWNWEPAILEGNGVAQGTSTRFPAAVTS